MVDKIEGDLLTIFVAFAPDFIIDARDALTPVSPLGKTTEIF